ncbi:four helix bundle protein [Oceanimonas smirnovii]|uniref:four helix bundle protein n=1 Tax=Oceanimonas smirnovii TaxID=264574 RepID=UPI003FD36C7C
MKLEVKQKKQLQALLVSQGLCLPEGDWLLVCVMDFEKLEVWKRSARMSADIYRTLRELKDWGFKDQITRAGLSIPSNIAEGMSRRTAKDKIQFLLVAKGSCAELRTQAYIGVDIGYIPREAGQVWIQETREIAAMISGLITCLQKDQDS